jgi:hypothetical protein
VTHHLLSFILPVALKTLLRGDDRVVVEITINGGQEKCPYYGSAKLYGHGMCDPRHILYAWTNGTKV